MVGAVLLGFQRKNVRDRRAKIYAVMDNLQFKLQDCNAGRYVDAFGAMTCVFIFQAGGQCKVLAGLAEMVHELLRVFG